MKKIMSALFVICIIFTICSCTQNSETETIPEFSTDLGDIDYIYGR